MLSSSRSGLRLELLFWLALVPRIYLASEGGVGTTLPLAPARTLESPLPARKASRTSARRMFSAAALTGERPREGSVGSSSFSVPAADAAEKDWAGGCEDRRSTMPDQLRGSLCAGMWGVTGRCRGIVSEGEGWNIMGLYSGSY